MILNWSVFFHRLRIKEKAENELNELRWRQLREFVDGFSPSYFKQQKESKVRRWRSTNEREKGERTNFRIRWNSSNCGNNKHSIRIVFSAFLSHSTISKEKSKTSRRLVWKSSWMERRNVDLSFSFEPNPVCFFSLDEQNFLSSFSSPFV